MNNIDTISSYPVLDLFFAILWIYVVSSQWKGVPPPEKEGPEERSIGATVIIGQLSAIITGSSIIIAGIGAFVALVQNTIHYPQNAHLLFATMWAVLSLGLSLYTMGILPHLTPKINFVRAKSVALFCATALFFSLAAGVRYLFAVSTILF